MIAANAEKLCSAIENVLRNAIRYTKNKSSIDISLQRATAKNELSNKPYYDVCIKDNGPGIPEKDLENIFEPFFRVDDARNNKTGGYGIGLAIAKRVISQHGGSIRARNTGSGLTVVISLPTLNDQYT